MPFGSETIKLNKFHFIKLQELWIEVEIWNWKRKILIYSIFFEMYGRIKMGPTLDKETEILPTER
jgi:hypothetical protein